MLASACCSVKLRWRTYLYKASETCEQEQPKLKFVCVQNLGGKDVGKEVEQKREAARARFAKQKADNEIEAAVIRAFLQSEDSFHWMVGISLHVIFLNMMLGPFTDAKGDSLPGTNMDGGYIANACEIQLWLR